MSARRLLVAAIVIFYGQVVFCDTDALFIQGVNNNVDQALQFLHEYDLEASEVCLRVRSAQWSYSTNMTDFNKRRMVDEQTHKARFDKVTWSKAMEFDWTSLQDATARRQLRMLSSNTRAGLPDEKYNEIYHLISEMRDIYSHIRVCPPRSSTDEENTYCDLELDPDVHKIMAQSRSNMVLTDMWKEWHDKVGPPMKNKFMRYVNLANEASKINGFFDAGEEMRYLYEDTNFENELAVSFQKLLPLYKQLLTYVRRRLLQHYGSNVIRPDGPLPAHILGNLWAQDWSNIADIVLPYPEYRNWDVSDEMLHQGFTSLRMFRMAEEFYTSIGLKPMPPEFWRHSMLERPNNRKVQCTASAWDFCNKIDFRIKQCTEVNMENLITAHHEMAHIEYYMYYTDQPYLYRDGANPGFHEGVSNAITLSVFNPIHLQRVGLYNNNTERYESNINFLLLMALKKIAYAPFAYLVDQLNTSKKQYCRIVDCSELRVVSELQDRKIGFPVIEQAIKRKSWRYQIFEDGVTKMNRKWWDLRLRLQGIVPPVPRTEAHFDAASKRHIPADIPYVRYYVALLLEFQIHEAMCDAAEFRGQLYTCTIYRSREAGKVLMDVLRVGKARHWKDVIKMLTKGNSNHLTADAMLEYFEPLMTWLVEQNKNERIIGWTTYKEDTALFQPLLYGSAPRYLLGSNLFVFVILLRWML